jgi:hypothetical protein
MTNSWPEPKKSSTNSREQHQSLKTAADNQTHSVTPAVLGSFNSDVRAVIARRLLASFTALGSRQSWAGGVLSGRVRLADAVRL